ncbi:hypothetical protein BDC45DRAFT_324023 [Circinella umbellata]|nr:hypothetical protein BDC45DRAFT_324023 [Circinella umbellata]
MVFKGYLYKLFYYVKKTFFFHILFLLISPIYLTVTFFQRVKIYYQRCKLVFDI